MFQIRKAKFATPIMSIRLVSQLFFRVLYKVLKLLNYDCIQEDKSLWKKNVPILQMLSLKETYPKQKEVHKTLIFSCTKAEQDAGEHYTTRSFMICICHQVLFVPSLTVR
jgi:hypothetical protein